jgi:adenylyl-sulfate kinase
MMGHTGCVVWLTGYSGSGKTTIACALEEELLSRYCISYVLDGDQVRNGLNSDLGFSPQDRDENIRRVGEVAALMADAGLIVVTAFISPYRDGRRRARSIMGKGRFIEVFLDVPLEVCEDRDPKGLYRKARQGIIPDFTGISAPYEPPENPELVLDTSKQPLKECVNLIVALLESKGLVKTANDSGFRMQYALRSSSQS